MKLTPPTWLRAGAALFLAVAAAAQTPSYTRTYNFHGTDRATGLPVLVYVSLTCAKDESLPNSSTPFIRIEVSSLVTGEQLRTFDQPYPYCPSPGSEIKKQTNSLAVDIAGPAPTSARVDRAALVTSTPTDHRLYVANTTGASGRSAIEVMDTLQRRFIAAIDVDDRLFGGMAVAPRGDRVYALLWPRTLGTPAPAYIAYINPATNAIVDRLELPGLVQLHEPALSPDGRYLYFAARIDPGSLRIRVADLQTKTVTILPDPVPANADLRAVALSPDGTLLCASGLGAVSCYDVRTRSFLGRAPASPPNREIAPLFHPNGSRIYLLGRAFVNTVLTLYISVIDTATLTEVARIPIVKPAVNDFRDSVARLRIDPTGLRLVLDERVNGVMNIIDTRLNRVVKTVEGLKKGGFGALIIEP